MYRMNHVYVIIFSCHDAIIIKCVYNSMTYIYENYTSYYILCISAPTIITKLKFSLLNETYIQYTVKMHLP